MLNSRRIFNIAAVALFVLFCFGLLRLFQLRFDRGDVFPPYSSFRADPLGVRVLFESLQELPGTEVLRHQRGFDTLTNGRDTTLLVLGINFLVLSEKERAALNNFVRGGGRLVITYQSAFKKAERSPAPTPSPTATASPAATQSPTASPKKDDDEPRKFFPLPEILKEWGIELEREVAPAEDAEEQPASRRIFLPLEEQLWWNSGIYFVPARSDWKEWQVIYAREDRAVMVERGLERGSIVLAGDSYFLSNEGVLENRAPALLSWLIGPNRLIIFDEAHLNVRENPGVVSLLRRYRLGGLALGLGSLLALWLWFNASASLSPRRSPLGRKSETVSGRESFSGFVNLLRRGIAPGEVVETCVAEWARSGPQRKPQVPAEVAGERNPAVAFNKLMEILGPRKWKRTSST